VGVASRRAPETIVAVLAIIKADAAYLPLDADYPAERLKFMLAYTGAQLVVADGEFAETLTAMGIECVSSEPGVEAPDGAPAGRQSPESLAYVMYTSGSTGRPKGVGVDHRNIARLVRNTNYIDLKSSDRVLHMAPLTFDASTFEIWGALLNGCRLVLYPDTVVDISDFKKFVKRQDISIVWLTSGLFNQVCDSGLDGFEKVRQLLTGGDALSLRHVEDVMSALPDCLLINAYGPTECTTFSVCAALTFEAIKSGIVPIGRPIGNAQVYVLDERLDPCPIGVVGELYIGGDGLSRGYLNRPGLTAERFIASPFGPEGSRAYRTGDRVRWRADGQLEFIGRNDHQVKVRGHRIELGEVETAMMSYPGVSEAVAIAREDASGDKRLLGYVVADRGETIKVAEVRNALRAALPDYLVPSIITLLAALPRTTSGKIDRSALPHTEAILEVHDPLEPSSPLEATLCAMWTRILGVHRIGVADNFFDLGGHSLLATQVIAELRDLFSINLALRHFFEAPTIAGLAEHLEFLISVSGPTSRSFAQINNNHTYEEGLL
jgi:amino acid adenylation domain-containing protein